MSAQQYTPTEAARRREQMIREEIVPVIRRAFDQYPALQSATLLVAQYWCDEAIDAVHCDLVFSELTTPDTESAYRARRRRYDGDDVLPIAPRSGWRRWFSWLGGSKVAPKVPMDAAQAPAKSGDMKNLPSGIDDETLEDEFTLGLPWDSNGEPISLFAAYCLEDCHQEMDIGEAYTPYAVFRRHSQDLTVDVVGIMHRPWLDGVKRQEEDE